MSSSRHIGITKQRETPETLPFTDDQVHEMTRLIDEWMAPNVPGMRYWEICEAARMDRPENLCGYQQRAFSCYWTLLHGTARGRIFLEAGSGGINSPASFGIDKFCGVKQDGRNYASDSANPYTHMTADTDHTLPFHDEQFAGVSANHVIEHLFCPERALCEWLRVTEEGGYVCIVTPDMAFSKRGSIDTSHTREFAGDELHRWLTDGVDWDESVARPANFELVEFNTLQNVFSVNAVLQKC